ncbi:FHA domain-containing protein, partial [Myxococcota bacterium]|nr:FHA domain-containing protein [Myxococcota bacterium]
TPKERGDLTTYGERRHETVEPSALVLVHGKSEDQRFLLSSDISTIGRDKRNDITIEDKFISKFHAQIIRRDGDVFIKDLDSRNKLFVNNSPAIGAKLRNLDRIQLGASILVFIEAGPAHRFFADLALILSQKHSITGLLKPNWLKTKFTEELLRAQRYHRQFSILSVAIGDLDLIRQKETEAGLLSHMQSCAQIIRQRLRDEDIIGMLAENRIAILLPETMPMDARRLAEDLILLLKKDFASRNRPYQIFFEAFVAGVEGNIPPASYSYLLDAVLAGLDRLGNMPPDPKESRIAVWQPKKLTLEQEGTKNQANRRLRDGELFRFLVRESSIIRDVIAIKSEKNAPKSLIEDETKIVETKIVNILDLEMTESPSDILVHVIRDIMEPDDLYGSSNKEEVLLLARARTKTAPEEVFHSIESRWQ